MRALSLEGWRRLVREQGCGIREAWMRDEDGECPLRDFRLDCEKEGQAKFSHLNSPQIFAKAMLENGGMAACSSSPYAITPRMLGILGPLADGIKEGLFLEDELEDKRACTGLRDSEVPLKRRRRADRLSVSLQDQQKTVRNALQYLDNEGKVGPLHLTPVAFVQNEICSKRFLFEAICRGFSICQVRIDEQAPLSERWPLSVAHCVAGVPPFLIFLHDLAHALDMQLPFTLRLSPYINRPPLHDIAQVISLLESVWRVFHEKLLKQALPLEEAFLIEHIFFFAVHENKKPPHAVEILREGLMMLLDGHVATIESELTSQDEAQRCAGLRYGSSLFLIPPEKRSGVEAYQKQQGRMKEFWRACVTDFLETHQG